MIKENWELSGLLLDVYLRDNFNDGTEAIILKKPNIKLSKIGFESYLLPYMRQVIYDLVMSSKPLLKDKNLSNEIRFKIEAVRELFWSFLMIDGKSLMATAQLSTKSLAGMIVLVPNSIAYYKDVIKHYNNDSREFDQLEKCIAALEQLELLKNMLLTELTKI